MDRLRSDCQTSGCEGDILIMSGGVGELLNSTLMDSFTGVRYSTGIAAWSRSFLLVNRCTNMSPVFCHAHFIPGLADVAHSNY